MVPSFILLILLMSVNFIDAKEFNQFGRNRRQAIYENIIKWNSPIYYSIDQNYLPDERDRLVKAMTIWANNSCIKFEENPSGRPLLQFVRDDYCHTYYGAPSEAENGIRGVYLGANCLMLSQIIHEIGHALGMIHTQQRTDRDDFIIVHYENVQPDYRVFYEKMVDSQTHGVPYDIGSVMHYDSHSFAIDYNSPSMLPIDPLYRHVIDGQSRGLTFADILLINTFYQCQSTCAQQGVVCSHGGIPNPNDCSQCICPSGFGGSRCEINAPPTYLPWMENDGTLANCGGILRATATATNLNASIDVPAFTQSQENPVDNYAACHWHIQADSGKRVAIQIEAISEDRCSDLCYYGNLDVKTKSDLRLTGYRFCCKSDLGMEGRVELVSESDLAVVSINSNHLKMEATMKYWQI